MFQHKKRAHEVTLSLAACRYGLFLLPRTREAVRYVHKHLHELTLVICSVIEWGVAPPSYGKSTRNGEDVQKDAKWAALKQQKHQILLSYNKVRWPTCCVFWVFEKECHSSTSELSRSQKIR